MSIHTVRVTLSTLKIITFCQRLTYVVVTIHFLFENYPGISMTFPQFIKRFLCGLLGCVYTLY